MLLFAALITVSLGGDIATRHDVADERYQELGRRFPSAVKVDRGGDGTLIASNWVLTAGHVARGLTRRTGGRFEVIIGDRRYSVAQVIVHPEFRSMGPHDLALLRLSEAVQDVAPARLYEQRDEVGQTIVLVGHGDTKRGTGGDWQADGLKRGATNVIDEATQTHVQFDFDAPDQGTELEGTAGPGDSGGPAYIERDGIVYLAGVSSLGEPGRNGPGTYGAQEHYVRVSSYVDWIRTTMEDPPSERLVNTTSANPGRRPGVIRDRPGALPEGIVQLTSIGLLVADRDGQVRMAGRIDQRYPTELLDAGIRPPAIIRSINGTAVESAEQLKQIFEAIGSGTPFTLGIFHNGQLNRFELTR